MKTNKMICVTVTPAVDEWMRAESKRLHCSISQVLRWAALEAMGRGLLRPDEIQRIKESK